MQGKQELYPKGTGPKDAHTRPEIVFYKGRPQCQRCGTWIAENCRLENGAYFCPGCLLLGRVTEFHELVTDVTPITRPKEAVPCVWPGTLTAKQAVVATALKECLDKRQNALLWAVTGSGKTEMLFPMLEQAFREGLQVAYATPRIDVCNEVYPRLRQAFPSGAILLRHSQGEEWRDFQLLVATTHQLLHFYRAFDLLIIDESDAFPYVDNPVLHEASRLAVKEQGITVHLTATPSRELKQQREKENWCLLTLFQRYHKRPLVVPELCFTENWRKLPEKKKGLKKLARLCESLLKDNRLLVFCPQIDYLKRLEQALQPYLAQWRVTSVSARDEKRQEKIQGMREGEWDVLLTSTVLERGVTFANVSVVVLGADHEVFTKSVLIQIAGRVDRLGEYRHGRVVFCYQEQTYPLRQAIAEIKAINRKRGQEDAL